MGAATHDLCAFSAASRDQQDAGVAAACASAISSCINTGELEVSEETVVGLCLRAMEARVQLRELRVKKIRMRSTDYAALLDILKRSTSLEVIELPGFVISDADLLDSLPRLCVSNATVSCEVAAQLVMTGRRLRGVQLSVGEDDEPSDALSALRNLPGLSAVSMDTSAMGTGAWDPFLFVLKNTEVRHLDIFHDVEKPWPSKLAEALSESRMFHSVRLELSSSSLTPAGDRAAELLRALLSSGRGFVKRVAVAVKLPELRPEVLSALLREVQASKKVAEVEVHCTGAASALVALGHVASGASAHVSSWQFSLAFNEGSAEAALAFVSVCAAAGVRSLTMVVRGPGGTVPDLVCEQLAVALARERGVSVKLICRVTDRGRAALERSGLLIADPSADTPADTAADTLAADGGAAMAKALTGVTVGAAA